MHYLRLVLPVLGIISAFLVSPADALDVRTNFINSLTGFGSHYRLVEYPHAHANVTVKGGVNVALDTVSPLITSVDIIDFDVQFLSVAYNSTYLNFLNASLIIKVCVSHFGELRDHWRRPGVSFSGCSTDWGEFVMTVYNTTVDVQLDDLCGTGANETCLTVLSLANYAGSFRLHPLAIINRFKEVVPIDDFDGNRYGIVIEITSDADGAVTRYAAQTSDALVVYQDPVTILASEPVTTVVHDSKLQWDSTTYLAITLYCVGGFLLLVVIYGMVSKMCPHWMERSSDYKGVPRHR